MQIALVQKTALKAAIKNILLFKLHILKIG